MAYAGTGIVGMGGGVPHKASRLDAEPLGATRLSATRCNRAEHHRVATTKLVSAPQCRCSLFDIAFDRRSWILNLAAALMLTRELSLVPSLLFCACSKISSMRSVVTASTVCIRCCHVLAPSVADCCSRSLLSASSVCLL